MRSDHPLLKTALPPSVQLVLPQEGLPHLDVSTRAATATVFFHGAHLARWTPAGARPPGTAGRSARRSAPASQHRLDASPSDATLRDSGVLWLSSRSYFRDDKAIRGGVPICFPWFGPHKVDTAAPPHGFARLMDWTLTEAAESDDGAVALTLVRDITPDLSPLWPYRCRATYRLSLGASLAMALDVEHVGGEPFTFEEALHTYFAISDIEQISIAGLEQTDYLDKVEGFARKRQPDEPIRFSGETDRVYVDTTAACRIADPGWSRTIVVEKSGSHTTVVWNPWAERAKAFVDFPADEWRRMVCVETANAGEAAIRLAPGASHTMQARISLAQPCGAP